MTGKITQFVPANSRSVFLADKAGGTRAGRADSVVHQVEALSFPWCRVADKTYESLLDTPCKGWDELHAWVASCGVAGSWPRGKPSTPMDRRLVGEGCGLYKQGLGPKLGQAGVDSYEKFQRKLGFTGTSAKWPPGPTSWARLKVPKNCLP